MAFKQFAWVPDGTYDYSEFLVRYVIVDSNPKTVISKDWVDKGGHDTLPKELRQPWGSFPDFPSKPPKKLT
jgi:hypothetical protein